MKITKEVKKLIPSILIFFTLYLIKKDAFSIGLIIGVVNCIIVLFLTGDSHK